MDSSKIPWTYVPPPNAVSEVQRGLRKIKNELIQAAGLNNSSIKK